VATDNMTPSPCTLPFHVVCRFVKLLLKLLQVSSFDTPFCSPPELGAFGGTFANFSTNCAISIALALSASSSAGSVNVSRLPKSQSSCRSRINVVVFWAVVTCAAVVSRFPGNHYQHSPPLSPVLIVNVEGVGWRCTSAPELQSLAFARGDEASGVG